MIINFRNQKVWQLAHELTLKIYQITKKFPPEEKYSLVDQIKRSSSSIAANIVEGNERRTKKEYIQFLYTAKGSCVETKYHLLLAKDLGYITESEYENLSSINIEVSKMLAGFINFIKSDSLRV